MPLVSLGKRAGSANNFWAETMLGNEGSLGENIKSFKNSIPMVDLPQQQQQNLLALQGLQCFVLVWTKEGSTLLDQTLMEREESSSLDTCWIICCWFSIIDTSPKCTGLVLAQGQWLSWTSQLTKKSTLVPSDVFPLDCLAHQDRVLKWQTTELADILLMSVWCACPTFMLQDRIAGGRRMHNRESI